MNRKITGPGLFFGAVGDVLRDWRVALRIMVVPLAIFLLFEAAMAGIHGGEPVFFQSFGASVARIVVFALLVGVVAVSWHRFKLCDEMPGVAIPRIRPRLWGLYAVAWIVLGLIVVVCVAVLVVVPLALIVGFALPDFGERLIGALWAVTIEEVMRDPLGSGGMAAGVLLILFVGMYGVFRATLGLPALAIERHAGFNMSVSWRRSAPLARPLLGVAALAGVGQLGFVLTPEVFLYRDPAWTDPGVGFSFAYSMVDATLLAVFDTVNTVFGAAILTRIYQALPSDEAPVAASVAASV